MPEISGDRINVDAANDSVYVRLDGVVVLDLSWPQANRLQYDLRQACTDAGITVRGL